jgi:hypothetical protein
MRDQTFGFCPDCGRYLPEMTEDGRCENRATCTARLAEIECLTLVESAMQTLRARLAARRARLA